MHGCEFGDMAMGPTPIPLADEHAKGMKRTVELLGCCFICCDGCVEAYVAVHAVAGKCDEHTKIHTGL